MLRNSHSKTTGPVRKFCDGTRSARCFEVDDLDFLLLSGKLSVMCLGTVGHRCSSRLQSSSHQDINEALCSAGAKSRKETEERTCSECGAKSTSTTNRWLSSQILRHFIHGFCFCLLINCLVPEDVKSIFSNQLSLPRSFSCLHCTVGIIVQLKMFEGIVVWWKAGSSIWLFPWCFSLFCRWPISNAE